MPAFIADAPFRRAGLHGRAELQATAASLGREAIRNDTRNGCRFQIACRAGNASHTQLRASQGRLAPPTSVWRDAAAQPSDEQHHRVVSVERCARGPQRETLAGRSPIARGIAAGFVEVERKFREVKGYREVKESAAKLSFDRG